MRSIVFIGNNPQVADMVKLNVQVRWPDVKQVVAATAAEGLELVEQSSPDMVLVHPDFVDMTLSQALRELRCCSNAPLLVLGCQEDDLEIITALELGADDYVRLPHDPAETMIRIWNLFRRFGLQPSRHTVERSFLCGQLGGRLVNPATYEVYLGGQRVMLTATEFRLLHLLVKNRGTPISHETLQRALWGEGAGGFDRVNEQVQTLRSKFAG